MKQVENIKSLGSTSSNYERIALLCICFLVVFISLSVKFHRFKFKTVSKIDHPIRAVVSHSEFDIVFSYYAEDIWDVERFIRYLKNVSTIQRLSPRVIVYNKNVKTSIEYLKDTLLADIVRALPNRGREGATYLTHIIENYDTIANHTLFSQAGVEGITDVGLADWFLTRLLHQFNSMVGYMPLVSNNWISTYDCGHHSQYAYLPRLPQLWGIVE
ncbi:unnamed protein product [Rotaria socialis]|uniref:Uncharacterized protein n=2 Tax=Rotaria socialis TaxID=392032 RepID=A0A820XPH8_9BILA|nr:unnamed protein product [Rotaria socialis]CAF4534673.1 unnamed protein product [Rotaria socialis]